MPVIWAYISQPQHKQAVQVQIPHFDLTIEELKVIVAMKVARKIGRHMQLPDVGQFDPSQMKCMHTFNPPYGKVLKREKMYSRIDSWRTLADLKTLGEYGIGDASVLHFQSKRPGQ